LTGKIEEYSEITCPSATFSTKNPTRPDPGSNPGRLGGKPATNHLSYGMGYVVRLGLRSRSLRIHWRIQLRNNVLEYYLNCNNVRM
jgi:hypothetical protein